MPFDNLPPPSLAARPLRVLFYCGGSYVSGAELIMLSVICGLRARGHQVGVVVNGWNDGDFIARLKAAGIRYHAIKLGFLYLRQPLWTLDTIIHYPGALLANARILRRLRPDVTYHVSIRTILMLAPLLDRRSTVLHVVETHRASRSERALYRLAAGRLDRVIAISQFTRSMLVELGVSAHLIKVVHPAVSGALAATSPPSAPRRGPHGPLRIGIVGQVIPRKGHQDLIDALAAVPCRDMAWTLEVYGKGDEAYTHELHARCRRHGLQDRVTWHGFTAERESIYAQLDLVVVPTRDEEDFGLVAAEPALWGLPVLASRCGGLPEVVLDERTGLLFEPGNVASLAACLARLLWGSSAQRSSGGRGATTRRSDVPPGFDPRCDRARSRIRLSLTSIHSRRPPPFPI